MHPQNKLLTDMIANNIFGSPIELQQKNQPTGNDKTKRPSTPNQEMASDLPSGSPLLPIFSIVKEVKFLDSYFIAK